MRKNKMLIFVGVILIVAMVMAMASYRRYGYGNGCRLCEQKRLHFR